MWHEGTIGVPEGKGKYTAVHYWIKHFVEPSEEYGINGGKISKLMLKANGEVIYNYDRGLDIDCQGRNAELALGILLKEYN